MQPPPKLLATAPSLDGIRKCISAFWGGATITLEPENKGWCVHNVNGRVSGFRVIRDKKSMRLRFEAFSEEVAG
jgi:hypothetical protein